MMPVFFLAELDEGGVEELYEALMENEVGCVVDIRLTRGVDLEGALRRLSDLHGRCVDYRWLKVFGNPFFDRDDPVESYEGYLMGMDRELEDLYCLIMERRCCIVDDCADPMRSYRTALGEALKKRYGIAFADLTMAGRLVDRYGGSTIIDRRGR
ncbi:DUF488 family protein [Methanocella conradii]|uniref:DUF488 family protein n=1 Tax=Methanocella conradii TaxID=1175444 RepID=UPI0024B38F2F|nr:DUF488 family protein [Methanocella conradii]MDI6898092.1 DUF488 family protein [Methanocella conradii]